MSEKETPKPNPRPPAKLSREDAIRQVVQQYIEDQRAVIETLKNWMRL
jgi:uncharacterized protein (DUF305 family)